MKTKLNPHSALPTPHSALQRPRLWTLDFRLWTLLLLLAPAPAPADDIPAVINYQGKLTDSAGKALTNGQYTIDFRIWNHPTSTNSADYVWGRQFPLYVGSNGMFNVLLSNDGGLLSTPSSGRMTNLIYAFDEPNRYLGLSIRQVPGGTMQSSAPEIRPRQQFASGPFAMHAQQAASAANFGTYSTNDFLMATKPNQTLNGSLTINNGSLLLKSNLTVVGSVSGILTVSGRISTVNLDASGNLQVGGRSTFSSPIDVHGGLEYGNTNLIVIQQFAPTNLPKDSLIIGDKDTLFPTNDWTAVIAGFTFDADVMETGKKSPWMRLLMVPGPEAPAHWHIKYYMPPEEEISGIKIDVMFMHRALAKDIRRF
jgi:hypothetical protein